MNLSVLEARLPPKVFLELANCMRVMEINNPLRLAHFLSQCHHESMGFTRVYENLNYSAESLLRVFPKYFTEESAQYYARNAVAIASRVYGGRMGNGIEETQDGYIFRGRGYLQLTGRENYDKFNSEIEEDLLINPDLVATKYPLYSAAWFWENRGLNVIADRGDLDIDVKDITKKINGGYNGVEERKKFFTQYYGILTTSKVPNA